MTENTNSTSTTQKDSSNDAKSGPPRLKGGQRQLVDAYFDNDSGLFVLNCVPGAGKSFVRSDLAAKELLRRWANGDRTPEQRLCVMTFGRNEAAAIEAEIIDRMRTLVTFNLTEAAAAVTAEEFEQLRQRVRRAPYIGTIDSVLRSLLADIVGDVGFTEMPTIGNDALLQRIHDGCFEVLESDSEHRAALERLQEAYPERKYDDSVGELLEQALQYCRSHQIPVSEFKVRLETSVDAVYVEGEPTSVDDITAAIARCVSDDESQSALTHLDQEDQEAVVDGDRDLYHAWQARIDDFCMLLAAYQAEYDTRIRDQGVISHLDCAYIVANYFGETSSPYDDVEGTSQRIRVLERHRNRIESWILDEAQDLSTIQHAAFSPFVTPDNRVAVAGDLRQSIYEWRDAHPELFASAVSDGTYFGTDWKPHIVETANRTYRCRPDVAAAINAIAEPALTGPMRGNLGDLDIDYPQLEPVRDPSAGPSVHIPAVDSAAPPGTEPYIKPESGKGEADMLATYIACGLADGTLSLPESESTSRGDTGKGSDGEQDSSTANQSEPAVTVLFRRRTYMERYAEAFEAQGLSVVNASEPLFACPSVEAVVNVVDWLADPCDIDQKRALIQESVLGLASLEELFKRHAWELDAVLKREAASLNDQQRAILTGLRDIRDTRGIQHIYTAPELAEEIIATLNLRADSYDIATSTKPAQRVANLDAFAEWLQTLQDEETITPDRLIDLVTPFQENPQDGPTQAVASTTSGDVEFRTCHQIKGDEATIVALADPGFNLWFPGSPNQRFITSGDIAALSPPETDNIPQVESLSVFQGGLYDPATAVQSSQSDQPHTDSTSIYRDVGLRWATERWYDHEDSPTATLVGHTHLQSIARNSRAELWRLLYVALTRAKDHLIVPLPRQCDDDAAADCWVDTIRDGLEFDKAPLSGTYCIAGQVDEKDSPRSVSISVNGVSLEAHAGGVTRLGDSTETALERTPFAGSVATGDADLQSFIPRIVRPSTLAPLSSNPDDWLLHHLQNKSIHTAADTIDEELPFDAGSIQPSEIGELIHHILASVIERFVGENCDDPEDCDPGVIAKQIVARRLRELPGHVRRDVQTFFWESVFPQFVNSACWDRIKSAEEVYIEKTQSGRIRVNDVEFEFDGQSDIVLQNADRDWEVIDLKIALGEIFPETRTRYQLQTDSYAFILSEEVDDEVDRCIEVFGAKRTKILTKESSDDLLQHLEMLTQNCLSMSSR